MVTGTLGMPVTIFGAAAIVITLDEWLMKQSDALLPLYGFKGV
jgi:hypothetical protein